MAGLMNQFFYYIGLIALLVLITSPQAYSSARFLRDFRPEEEKKNGMQSVQYHSRHVFPCDEMESGKNTPVKEVAPPQKVVEKKYGRPLVLNLLPKGTVTPSGPSKGINELND